MEKGIRDKPKQILSKVIGPLDYHVLVNINKTTDELVVCKVQEPEIIVKQRSWIHWTFNEWRDYFSSEGKTPVTYEISKKRLDIEMFRELDVKSFQIVKFDEGTYVRYG